MGEIIEEGWKRIGSHPSSSLQELTFLPSAATGWRDRKKEADFSNKGLCYIRLWTKVTTTIMQCYTITK